MTKVHVKFASKFHLMFDKLLAMDTVRTALANGEYKTRSHSFDVDANGEDAAEEVFDLTNNPSRQDERVEVYGMGRSVSSGDIVVVGEDQWVCLSVGWAKLHTCYNTTIAQQKISV